MEFKVFSKKGALIILCAVVFAIGAPLLVVTQWQVFKYLMPLFVGTFFFFTVNGLKIGAGVGAIVSGTLIAWILPLTGIPKIQEGLYSWLIGERRFGPPGIAILLYSLPALITLCLLMRRARVLPK
jgi:hypothetical protein